MEACGYHSRKPASWVCEGCNKPYCTQCVPGGEANFAAGQPRCPLCSQRLEWRGDGQPGLPFWKRSKDILRYPVQLPALWLVLLFGGANAAIGGLPTLLLFLFVAMLLSVYSLLVIADVAGDKWTPPSPMDAISEGGLLVRQIGVMLVLFVGPALLAGASMVLTLGLLALATLIMPAVLMILAVSRSLRSALNPLRWLQLIVTVGGSYLLLWLAVMAVSAAPAMLESGDASAPLVFVGGVFSAYTTLVAAAMMGALLNEKARELGLAADEDRGLSLSADDYEVAESLGIAHIYAQEGRLEDALRLINRGLGTAPMHQELNWRRLRLLRLLGKEKPWKEHLMRFIRAQHSMGNQGTAVQIWLEALQQESWMRLEEDPALSVSLARSLHERGRVPEARRLLVNMHKWSPGFSGLAEAYLLLAHLYLEEGDAGTAGKLLGFVKRQSPGTLESDEGTQVLSLFHRLSSPQSVH